MHACVCVYKIIITNSPFAIETNDIRNISFIYIFILPFLRRSKYRWLGNRWRKMRVTWLKLKVLDVYYRSPLNILWWQLQGNIDHQVSLMIFTSSTPLTSQEAAPNCTLITPPTLDSNPFLWIPSHESNYFTLPVVPPRSLGQAPIKEIW